MKKPILLSIIAVALVLAVFSWIPSYAQQFPETVNIYAWTDKTYYEPGESGKLTIVVRNDRKDVDLILYNITITYPWFAYTGEKWEGNETITVGETLLKNGGNVKTFTRPFTVPPDGRAVTYTYGARITVRANVDKSPFHYEAYPYIYITSVPYLMSISDWDKLMTLVTIHVVLVIVCTIILAATIFLSRRRPKTVFEEEAKAE